MNNITLITVDGKSPEEAARLMNWQAPLLAYHSRKLVTFREPEVKLDSSIELILIPKLDYKGYNNYVVQKLISHVDSEHCLLIQPDGFVINPDKFKPEFLEYDYIGAPWPLEWIAEPYKSNRVGNGGFSLRSRRLLEWGSTQPEFDMNEDVYLCQIHRQELEALGLKFAPLALACKFSLEGHIPEFDFLDHDGQFGGHQLNTILRKRLNSRIVKGEHNEM